MRLYLLLLCCFCCSLKCAAQVIDGEPTSFIVIRVTDTSFSDYYIADSATVPLWQIGRTHKTFFTTDTSGAVAIMTDTVDHYPINCDHSFILKIPFEGNRTICFWHRYWTDSGRDGGVVEFSRDEGVTWQNVKGDCNGDGSSSGHSILTDNFYGTYDTLAFGQAAFSGSSDTTRFSRFQFFYGYPERPTAGWECDMSIPDVLVRFRFISDTIVDTLDGWMIDSIALETDYYGEGAASNLSPFSIAPPFPNPSMNGVFTFPALKEEETYTISVTNMVGQKIVQMPYSRQLKITGYPSGLYYYTVSGEDILYTGKLLYDH